MDGCHDMSFKVHLAQITSHIDVAKCNAMPLHRARALN